MHSEVIWSIKLYLKGKSFLDSVELGVFSVELCVTNEFLNTYTECHRGVTEYHRENIKLTL